MTRKKKKKHQKEKEQSTPEPKPAAEETEAPLEEDLEDLRKRAGERDEYYDTMLRARADLDNLNKRMIKERGRIKEAALREFLSDMMPALDALHVAVCHPEEADPTSLLDGIRLMEKQLADTFSRNGIEIVEPAPGDVFDPALHEAVLMEPSDEFDEGHVIESLRRGFLASGILVRPAQVKVAAGEKEEDNEEEVEVDEKEKE